MAGRVKRGGARFIWNERDRCYLIFADAKNVQGDLTPAQLKILAADSAQELGDGQTRFR